MKLFKGYKWYNRKNQVYYYLFSGAMIAMFIIAGYVFYRYLMLTPYNIPLHWEVILMFVVVLFAMFGAVESGIADAHKIEDRLERLEAK